MKQPPEKPQSPPLPSSSLSQKLSTLTKGTGQPEEVQKKIRHQQEQDNEEVHFDDRWLMSDADKMTLLCGCFIMLFAISTIDPIRLKQLQKETEKSFGRPTGKEENKAFDHQQVSVEAPKQEEIIGSLLKTNEELKEQIVSLRKENNATNAEVQKVTEEKQEIQKTLNQVQSRLEEIKQTQAQLIKTNDPTKAQQMVKTIQTLEKEKIQLNGQIEDLQQRVMTRENKIENLNRQISSLEDSKNQSTFLAFVMSWSTAQQDIDLYVTDPAGRTFDFKKRNYENHPGLLVLDTRQGPGVEVWQSDRVIPGIYSFKYFFYNSYGNNEPCNITGTLFTPKGRVSLPSIVLTPQNKTQTIRFQIDEEGKAKAL